MTNIQIDGYIHPASIELLNEFSTGIREHQPSYTITCWDDRYVKYRLTKDRSFNTFRKYRITIKEISE